MLKDLSQEITNQSNNLIQLAPKILKLNEMLEKPIISDDLMEEYLNVPPAKREAWVEANVYRINVDIDPQLDKLMIDLINQMDAIFGSSKRVESLMSTQQQENLQAAQKPSPKETAFVESLE